MYDFVLRLLRSKNIKKMVCSLFALLFAVSAAQTAFAHPPKSVALTWNGGTLAVNVTHNVNDPGKHYVYKIIVYANDNVVSQREYSSQGSADGLADTFDLGSLPVGTNVKAEAFCVIMGSATGSITVR